MKIEIKHCISKQGSSMRDLTGIRFGCLTAISPTSKRSRKGGVFWLCGCNKCGKDVLINGTVLLRNPNRKCTHPIVTNDDLIRYHGVARKKDRAYYRKKLGEERENLSDNYIRHCIATLYKIPYKKVTDAKMIALKKSQIMLFRELKRMKSMLGGHKFFENWNRRKKEIKNGAT